MPHPHAARGHHRPLPHRRPALRRGEGRPRHGRPLRRPRGACRSSASTSATAPSPRDLIPQLGRAGRARREPPGLRLRGHEQRHLRPHAAGARARRLGPALLRLGAGLAVHVPDPRLRLRGAEAALPARAWRGASSSAASASPSPTSAPTPAACAPAPRKDGDGYVLNGTQDLDHQRHHRRRRGGLGQDRRRRRRVDPRLPRGEGDARLHARGRFTGSSRCARRHLRAVVPGRARARRATCCPGAGPEGAALVPQQRALRHRLRGRPARRSPASRARASTRSARVQFDKPIAGFQLTQEKLADMLQEIVEGAAARRCGSAGSRTRARSTPGDGARWPSATT